MPGSTPGRDTVPITSASSQYSDAYPTSPQEVPVLLLNDTGSWATQDNYWNTDFKNVKKKK